MCTAAAAAARRVLSSLWDVTLFGRPRTTGIHELQRGGTRRLTFTSRVRRSA